MEMIFSSNNHTTLVAAALLLLAATFTNADLTSQELDAALFALRSNGYTLFPNAIATSDVQYRLLSSENTTFTLFAPPDSLLFSLDLLSSARLYTFSLLLHASPHLLTMSDLLSLPEPYVETLLPNRHLFVDETRVPRNGSVLPTVSLDGISVSVPDLFIGSNIVVHGLDGILVARYRARFSDGDSADQLGPSLAPNSNIWCESCVSPAANPPAESLPPMGMESSAPEMVSMETGMKKDGWYYGQDGDDGAAATVGPGSRHGKFFLFKHLFTRNNND